MQDTKQEQRAGENHAQPAATIRDADTAGALPISIRKISWRDWSAFAAHWERLHNVCPAATFFTSREWVDNWLAIFGEKLNPELLAFEAGGELVGCCILVWRTQLVRGIPLRRVFLNCTGEDDAESTYIEFNSLVAARGASAAIARSLAAFLRTRFWDEFLVRGATDEEGIQTLIGCFDRGETEESPSRFIDLRQLRASGTDYLSHISAKARKNIRRTQRSYEHESGPCSLKVAASADEAIEMLRELASLHQTRFEKRGAPGAFSSARFWSLHERIIRHDFQRTLLFRLMAGTTTIGMLYCFLYRGQVYYYQSGFSYSGDKTRSPGLLTLSFAISYCLENAAIEWFDLMAGDAAYKRSLSAPADFQILRWITVRRNTPMALLFVGLRSLKRKYAQFRTDQKRSQRPDGGEPGTDTPVPPEGGGNADDAV